MRLAYMTLCLIIHTINMIRIRAKVRWRFIMPLGVQPPQIPGLGIRSSFPQETWDMSPSCLFVTPTMNFLVLVTRAAATNWT